MAELLKSKTIGESVRVLNPVPQVPLVAHIPHSSPHIPQDVFYQFTANENEMFEENRALVDWFTDELFDFVPELGGTSLVYQVSRFVCDPERFEANEQEPMAERGMGVLYTHGVNRNRIRQDLSAGERENLLNRFYRPHHHTFSEIVLQCLNTFGRCLILDCHSYPELELPYELYGKGPRPAVCIGADEAHSSNALLRVLERSAIEHGYEISYNSPFKGSIVPLQLLGDSRVHSLMFEIRRDIYMDETATVKSENFPRLKNWLREVTENLLQEFCPASAVSN